MDGVSKIRLDECWSFRYINNVRLWYTQTCFFWFCLQVMMEMTCIFNSLCVNLFSTLSVTTACTGSDQSQTSCPSTLTQVQVWPQLHIHCVAVLLQNSLSFYFNLKAALLPTTHTQTLRSNDQFTINVKASDHLPSLFVCQCFQHEVFYVDSDHHLSQHPCPEHWLTTLEKNFSSEISGEIQHPRENDKLEKAKLRLFYS